MELLEHLEMSIGFYFSILAQAHLQPGNTFFSLFQLPNPTTRALLFNPPFISILFCRVGDLYRYSHSLCDLEGVKLLYWENAKASYDAAGKENPHNGLSFNNLGVLYAGRREVMLALEYYCKAMACENTTTSALTNARGLLDHYRDCFDPRFLYVLQPPPTSQSQSSTNSTIELIDEQEKFIYNTLSSLL